MSNKKIIDVYVRIKEGIRNDTDETSSAVYYDYKFDIEEQRQSNDEEYFSDILATIQMDGEEKMNELPGLVLAVVGDSESFVPKAWNTTAFTSGLLQTLNGAKKSWLIYRGNNDGVSSYIGNAFKRKAFNKPKHDSGKKENDKVHVSTASSDVLRTTTSEQRYNTKKQNETQLIAIQPYIESTSYIYSMDHMADWFFLVKPEGNMNEKMKDEWFNQYLAKFLGKLSLLYTPLLSKKTEDGKQRVLLRMRVPVLLVVVEGDIFTIHQVKLAVKRNVPVLLVRGTGKAADFIADYLNAPSEGEKYLKEKAPLLFGIYIRKEVFEKLKRTMEKIAKYHYLVTIFDIDNTTGVKIEDSVVEAIIKGWSLKELTNSETITAIQPITATKIDLYSQHRKAKGGAQTITCNVIDVFANSTIDHPHVPSTSFMHEFQFTLAPGSLSLYFYIAYQYIQEQDIIPTKEKTYDKHKDLQLLLLEAIIADRVDYASAMLQTGVHFDPHHMERLYDETLQCKECDAKDCRYVHAIHHRIDEEICRKLWCVCRKECELKPYECEYKTHHYTCEGSKQSATKCVCERHSERKVCGNGEGRCQDSTIEGKVLCQDSTIEGKVLCQKLLNYPKDDKSVNVLLQLKSRHNSVWSIDANLNGIQNQEEVKEQTDVFYDLLAWALFANRKDLAGVFWTNCENQLLTGIMSCSILKNMAEAVESAKDRKLHDELIEHSRLFEERVLKMQSSLYEEEELQCMELMRTPDTIWGIEVTPMECAYDNNMIDVIGHPCIQRLLNRMWYNQSAINWKGWVKSLVPCFGIIDAQRAWKSPLTVFVTHYLLFMALLIVFSAFILTDVRIISRIAEIGIYEILLYVWLLGDIVEEVLRNIIQMCPPCRRRGKDGGMSQKWFRFKVYISNFWNILTLLSYLIIFFGIVVRIVNLAEYNRMLIRLYSFGLFVMYMRFLQSMLVLSYFGPKIIMIGKMLIELIKIGWILIVFIMCTGVLYHANMYPNHYDMWSTHGVLYWRIWKIISLPYWQIYGELSLDEIKGENNDNSTCTFVKTEWESFPERHRCVETDWSLMIIAAFYMLITNLLLVNLVIALFTYRFEEVQDNSDRLWKFWRYSIITDYETRFPVPLNLVMRPIYYISLVCKKVPQNLDHMKDLQKLHAIKCLYEENKRKL